MKIIIIAGGTAPSKKLLTKEITKNSVIIAVDSGANCLWKYKITPDYLIGDLDSIDHKSLKFFINKKVSIETHPCEKNQTDTELALEKAIKLKAKKIIFLGALGGERVDHLLGALGLLEKCLKAKIDSVLKDDYQTITLINKPTTIYGKPKELFSLQAYGTTVKDLNISSSKYPLKNYSLKMGDGLTLSNEFRNKKVSIKFRSGKLLVMLISNGSKCT